MVENKLIFEVRKITEVYAFVKKINDYLQGHLKKEEAKLVFSELATNLAKHTKGGTITVENYGDIICIISEDNGPGIDDLSQIISSKGYGFQTIFEFCSYIKIVSHINLGTKVKCILGSLKNTKSFKIASSEKAFLEVFKTNKFIVVASTKAKKGFTRSGDGYFVEINNNNSAIVVFDSLGHGEEAYLSTKIGIDHLLSSSSLLNIPNQEIFSNLNEFLKNQRGAAVGICKLVGNNVIYSCFGNIVGKLYNSISKTFVSSEGIVGCLTKPCLQDIIKIKKDDMLKFYTDGIESKWGLLKGHNPYIEVINGMSKHSRDYDDATCIAVKII